MDFLTKKKVINEGIAPQYYVENSHEAIIPKDLFMRTQEEMKRRANLNSGKDRRRRIYSSKYALSSMVICAHCGDIFRRIKWNNRGCKSTVWRCVSRVEKKNSGIDCPARTVKEEVLHSVVVDAVNQILEYDTEYFETYKKGLETALGANDEGAIRIIDEKLHEKQKELIKLSPSDKAYDELTDEIYDLREEKRKVLLSDAARQSSLRRVEALMDFVSSQTDKIEEYDDDLVRKLLEKIIVHDNYFTVLFKSGMEVEAER